MSDPHDSNLRRAADFCRDLGRHASAEAISRAIGRIAELEAAEAVLHAKGEMLFDVVQGAKKEFVRAPYGASHEDVAAINEWHKMAAEALAAWENEE